MTKTKRTSNSQTKSRKKQSRKRTPSKQTVKVQGYWRVSSLGNAYFVRPYKYERKIVKQKSKPKPKAKSNINEPPKRKKPRKAPPGYTFRERIEVQEAEERVVYTYKIEALVEYTGRYTMQFKMDKDLQGQLAIEYYHTHFEPTIEKATVDFQELIPILNAQAFIVTYLAIDLYRVTGVGHLRDKHWKLIKSFDRPEEVK